MRGLLYLFIVSSSMKTALVIGASGGLGREITLTLLIENCHVIAIYNKAKDSFIEYFGEYKKNVTPFKVDIRNINDIKRMVKEIEKKFITLDYVVNSAGIAHDSLLIKTNEDLWDDTITVNLTGCFHIIKNTVTFLINAKGGHIVNISSISGIKGKIGQTAYSASKAALIGLTCAAAKELAEYNIRVNTVLPGYMKTDMGMKNPKALEKARETSLLKTLSSPSESASFICKLLNTDHVTGQVFILDSRII